MFNKLIIKYMICSLHLLCDISRAMNAVTNEYTRENGRKLIKEIEEYNKDNTKL